MIGVPFDKVTPPSLNTIGVSEVTSASLNTSYVLSIFTSIFAAVSFLTSIISANIPWAEIKFSLSQPHDATLRFGLLNSAVCYAKTCTTYSYDNPLFLTYNILNIDSPFILGGNYFVFGLLIIGGICHFVAMISAIVAAIGARAAKLAPEVVPPHCGCLGTAVAGTRFTAAGFTLSWLGAIIGNVIFRRYFTPSTATYPGGDVSIICFVTSLLGMSLMIANKCQLRRNALSTGTPQRTVLTALLGGAPEAHCCV